MTKTPFSKEKALKPRILYSTCTKINFNQN